MNLRCGILGVLTGVILAATSAAAEKILIRGSNTFGEELGVRLIAEFHSANPGITVDLESKGTATGFAALTAGECDIAAASRAASEDEFRLARSRGVRLNTRVIGYYGVTVIVNHSSPIASLSDEQVLAIFTGAITDWKSVGGQDGVIQTYIRDPSSGTYLGFQELAMNKQPYASSARRLPNYSEIARAVHADPNGIGYIGMQVQVPTGVRPVTINGIPPTPIAVNEGLYPYARQLTLLTNRRHESPAATRFIRFVLSRRGQETLEQLGYVGRSDLRQGGSSRSWF